MLPFFASEFSPWLAPAPRVLNEKARAGELHAACMSAIAGIRAGFGPLDPLFVISAWRNIGSVFLEPLNVRGREDSFWANFVQGNKQGLARLPAHGVIHPLETVTLFTTGASEQSEWLFRVLLRASGFPSRVLPLEKSLLAHSPEHVTEILGHSSNEGPAALLVIGDPALERQNLYPRLPRIDLADLWNDFSGLPCIFAIWFNCARQAPEHSDVLASLAGALEQSLCSWEKRSEASKRARALEFLSRSSSASALPARKLHGEFDVLSYLANIEFRGGPAHGETFREYVRLDAHFAEHLGAEGNARSLPEPRTHQNVHFKGIE